MKWNIGRHMSIVSDVSPHPGPPPFVRFELLPRKKRLHRHFEDEAPVIGYLSIRRNVTDCEVGVSKGKDTYIYIRARPWTR